MSVWAGVGGCASRRSREAGRAAASAAAAGRAPALCLVFATAGHDQAELLAGVREAVPDAPISGCAGAGVIAQDGVDETSHAVRVMAIGGAGLRARATRVTDAAADPRAAAAELAAALRGLEPRVVLLFPDGLTIDTSTLIAELASRLPGVPLVGGTSGEMERFEKTFQYHGTEARSDSVSAVALAGPIDVEIALTHDCDLLGLEHVVTRADGPLVFELDGRPAWDVLATYLEHPLEGLGHLSMPYLCMAHPLDEARGFDGEVIMRAPLRVDPRSGALFFPGALPRGQRLMMARRDREHLREGAVKAAEAVRTRAGRPPAFVLQIECASRGAVLFGDRLDEELIAPVQRVLGKEVPWIGFFSYGEIGSHGARPAFHNKTMVLCAVLDAAR